MNRKIDFLISDIKTPPNINWVGTVTYIIVDSASERQLFGILLLLISDNFYTSFCNE